MKRTSLVAALAAALTIGTVALVVPSAIADKTAPASAAKPDKDMQTVLDALAALNGKPVETLTPAEARLQPTPTDAVKAVIAAKTKKPAAPEPVGNVADQTYPSAAGDKLPLRIYTPKDAPKDTPKDTKKGAALPVIVYFHGGGWVIANLDVYDAAPRSLANQTGAIVVSAEYHLAPEKKFPAAHDDAFAAYAWVRANAASFGGDPERIAVAGESAGANLAINVAIKARDTRQGTIAHMLLVYPVAGKDMTTPSYVANADAKPLSKPMMQWFVKNTFATPDGANDPRIDLVDRTDLAGLPSTTLVTAEIDPLMSEGQALGKKLVAAGVKVDELDVKGVTHEFFGMGAVVAKAKATLATSAKDLKASLAKVPAKVGSK